MRKLPLIIAACAMAASPFACHASGYIGASIGQTNIDIPGFDDGDSIAISGGYKFSDNFAIEASYVELGDSKDNEAPVWTLKADGINLAAIGIIPATDKIDVFGKLGMYMWDFSVNEAGFGEIYSKDGTDLSLGFGASMLVTERFGLVVEYQEFEVDDEDLSNISLGARFRF